MSQNLALAASKESEDWSLITSWERFVKIDGKVKAIGEARPGDECLGQMDLRTRLATEFGSSDGCGQNTILRIGELTFCFFNFRGIWEIRVILDHNVGMISWSSRWSITDGEARVPSAPEVHEEPGAARTRHVRSPREIHEEENYD